MSGEHLQLAGAAAMGDILLTVGYAKVEEGGEKVGYVFFEMSRDGGRTKAPFKDGNTRKRIGRADRGQPSVCARGTSEILVALAHKGQIHTYLSEDMGETWQHTGTL